MTKKTAAAVELLGGDPLQAILEIANTYGIAVAYQIRESIDPDSQLTDEQWENHVMPRLSGYDEWLDNSGAAESIDVWRFSIVDEALHPGEAAA